MDNTTARLECARQNMVDEQLRAKGIVDRRVLAAMQRVPRERFIAPELIDEAYADRAIAIDCGQTISQPFIVALMSRAMELSGTEHVLEIGTGSGYQTAILAELAESVVSIERHPELSRQAAALLDELGYRNVELIVGDGAQGWPPRAPYDRILAAAAAAFVPPALFAQLAEGGVLVIPIGDGASQVLQAVRKIAGRAQTQALSNCRFVPFVGVQHAEG